MSKSHHAQSIRKNIDKVESPPSQPILASPSIWTHTLKRKNF